jgi:O-antigen/teichoic acid export membrane protein
MECVADESIADEITAPVVPGEHSRHIPPPLSVRRNFAWSLAGNVLYAVCQWGVLIVLAKLCSTETLGLYLLSVATTAPIFQFAGMQLRRLQATDSGEEFLFEQYLGLQLLACGVGLVASWGWCVFAGHRDAALAVILLVGLNKAFETLLSTLYGLYQQRERLDRISISMTLHGLFTAGGLCGGVVLTGDIVWAVGLSAAARILAILVYDVPNVRLLLDGAGKTSARTAWKWSARGGLKQLAVLGIPLGVTTMLVSLNTNIPRWSVESHCGLSALGIFGALCTPLAVMHTLTQALEASASARLARLFAAGDLRGFRRLVGLLLATHTGIALVGVLVVQLFGRQLLTLMFTAEYAEQVDVFVTIMWATLIATSAGVLMTALIAARFLQIQLPLIAATSLAALLACYWLVPVLGLQGAAISLAVSKLPYIVVGLWLLVRAKPKAGAQGNLQTPLAPSSKGGNRIPSDHATLRRAA